MDWQPIETAPKNVILETKIDDKDGVRNVQKLRCIRGLWYVPDGSMYVYHRPTHWRSLPSTDREG